MISNFVQTYWRLKFCSSQSMKSITLFLLVFVFYFCSCKTKPAEVQAKKYFVIIDEVQKTVNGPVDTNMVEEITCPDDRTAINKGLEKYYNTDVAIETRDKTTEPSVPYVLIARGWAILDAKGEDVRSRVSPSFIDSSTERAIENAKDRQDNLQVQ